MPEPFGYPATICMRRSSLAVIMSSLVDDVAITTLVVVSPLQIGVILDWQVQLLLNGLPILFCLVIIIVRRSIVPSKPLAHYSLLVTKILKRDRQRTDNQHYWTVGQTVRNIIPTTAAP